MRGGASSLLHQSTLGVVQCTRHQRSARTGGWSPACHTRIAARTVPAVRRPHMPECPGRERLSPEFGAHRRSARANAQTVQMPRSDTPRLPAGGVTRSSLLLNAGWSRHQLDRAVGAGLLTRPKKGWLARRDADPALVYAATHGVIISCVSQAKRRGLWVPHHDRSHAAVRVPGRTDAGSTVLHWRAPLLQREPHSLEDPIENALDLVAHCLPFEDAVAV